MHCVSGSTLLCVVQITVLFYNVLRDLQLYFFLMTCVVGFDVLFA